MTDPKWWDMTLKKGTFEVSNLMEVLDRECERYVIGEEVGEGGYEHYQIRAVFKVPKAMSTVHNVLKEASEIIEGWVTPTSQNGRNFNYCEKEGKFIRSWEKALRKFASLELNDWQCQLQEIWKHQNERQCDVLYNESGNIGKTYFAKYMQATHQAQYVPPMGDAQDLMAFALEKPAKAYIFDMPRCESVKQKKGMWSAVEQIKNGYLYDKRYKFRDAWIEPPRVLVMCNELPDMESLSADRWRIYTVEQMGKESLLMPYEVTE